MSEIAKITNEDIRWDADEFEDGIALAVLLAKEVAFINDHWWRQDLTKKDRGSISVQVVCSDIFAWGCADAERLPFNQIRRCYEAWEADPEWGAAAWCITQRQKLPQPPVADAMTKRGYDVEALASGKLSLPRPLQQEEKTP